jgi:hypothetical protein
MTDDLIRKLDTAIAALELQAQGFDEGTKCCFDALRHMSERVERLEQWMLKEQDKKVLVT